MRQYSCNPTISLVRDPVRNHPAPTTQLLHHILKNPLKINQDERVYFSKWMDDNDYHNIHEHCDDLQFDLKHIHD